jgi:hypothetical protein
VNKIQDLGEAVAESQRRLHGVRNDSQKVVIARSVVTKQSRPNAVMEIGPHGGFALR